MDVGRRLLEALQEGVGGLDVEPFGLDHDPDAAGREEGLEAQVGDERGDLFDADELALAFDHGEVGVHPAGEALAVGAVPAAPTGGHQGGAELEREAPLAEALGPSQQVGVARSARQRAGEVGLGPRLTGNVSEHRLPPARRALPRPAGTTEPRASPARPRPRPRRPAARRRAPRCAAGSGARARRSLRQRVSAA